VVSSIVPTYTDQANERTGAEAAPSKAPQPGFRDTLRQDLYRYRAASGLGTFLKAYRRNHAFRFTFWLRAGNHFVFRSGKLARIAYLICRVIREHYSIRFGYQVYEETQIGPGFYIGHVGSVVINPEARIGRNVNIAIGVTIGQANRGKRAGAPTIGDRVWVGTNAVVVGKITVGNGALIGPGAYVNFDVPPNAVVVGNPGQVISESGTAGYIQNTLVE
jgi:serine O-acetyltransferase